MFLVYAGEQELVVTGYTDAGFQTDQDDSKLQSGYVFTINSGAVSWKSSKQEIVVDSTIEVEYIATLEAAKEGVWIRKFLSELGVVPSVSSPLDLYLTTMGILRKQRSQGTTKKISMYCENFIGYEEIARRGDIKICKVHMDLNVVDPLTKPLPQPKHERT
jgi:hypothetical protein